MPNTTSNLYTIKDISDITGIHPQTLRNWEKESLIEPIRVAGNQRIYTDEHIARIKEIVELKEEGLQLKGVRNVLLGKSSVSNKSKSPIKKREAKPLMSAAQTLEKTAPKKPASAKKESKPVVSSTTVKTSPSTKTAPKAKKAAPKMETKASSKSKATPAKKASKSKYSQEKLEGLTLKELAVYGKKEQIRYFRQMNKGELITALVDLDRREEMEMIAKVRTKGLPKSQATSTATKAKTATSSKKEPQKEVAYAQTTEQTEIPFITEESNATKEGLVEANIVEDAKEEMDQQQYLIMQILKMGEEGKSPEEIAKQLVSVAKK